MAIPSTVPFLGWAWDDLLFLLLGGVMLGSALLVVLGRDIIRAGLTMMVSFAALAGIYVLLGAPLVAAAQVLVYIGAISVLILFSIMLTQSKSGPARLVFHHQAWAAGVAAVVLALLLGSMVVGTTWPQAVGERTVTDTVALARLLFTDYVLVLEVIGVLLVAAVIGGVFLAKREDAANPVERLTEPTPGTDFAPGGPSGTMSGGIGSSTPAGVGGVGGAPGVPK